MRQALMSSRRLGPAVALALLVGNVGAPARAQGPSFGGPGFQPAVPPILNLNRLGAPPGVNYYNIVQPQVQFQAAISQLQQQTTQLQYAATAVGPGANLATGHPVFYGNYSHYYATRGLAGVGGYGGGGLGTVSPFQRQASQLGGGAGLGGQRAGQGFGGTSGMSGSGVR